MPANPELLDISESGVAVNQRIADAEQAQEIVTRLINLNRARMERVARVQGMVDGNPPESRAKMRRESRGNDANINWREAKGHIQNAWTPYYDLSVEVPVIAEGDLSFAGPEIDTQLVEGFMRAFHKMVFGWAGFDKNEQLCNWQMLEHGIGTQIHENEWTPFPSSVPYSNVLVDDETECDLENAEILLTTADRSASWLWKQIRGDESQAAVAGWNVEAVKRAIMKAGSAYRTSGWQWSKWQQALNNGDLYVSSTLTKKIQTATLFVKEMDGTISVHIVQYPRPEKVEFLYSRIGLYESWEQCVHTYPYDIGTDGTYHSVKGLGDEIYSYCDLSNRIKNQMANMVLTSIQPMFQPKSGKDAEKFQLIKMGGYNILPPGVDAVQTNISGGLSPAMAVSQEFQSTLARNTGTYHQDLEAPRVEETAKAVQIRAMDRAKLTKGAHNRFYRSKDRVIREMWRRATNPKIRKYHPGGREAVKFQEECYAVCDKLGVPHQALQKVENVRAFRSFGMGNAALRADIASELMQLYPLVDPVGKNYILRAKAAATIGYTAADAITKSLTSGDIPTEDDSVAALENNALATGGEVVITPRQDHGIHLKHHVASMGKDVEQCQQGGDIQACYSAMSAKGAHSQEHLALLKENPLRRQEAVMYAESLSQLAAFQAQLEQNIREMQEANPQEQPGNPSPQMVKVQGSLQLKAEKQQGDMALKQQRLQHDMALKEQQARADIALKDAETAASIRRDSASTKSSIALNTAETVRK